MDLDKLMKKCSKRLEQHFNEIHKLELSGGWLIHLAYVIALTIIQRH